MRSFRIPSLLFIIILAGSFAMQPIHDGNKSLLIGGFVPGVDMKDLYGYLTALEMARDWLNENHIIPENYTIRLNCRETMGNAGTAILDLGHFLAKKPKEVAFLGPAFSRVLRPIAQALQSMAILQVSFGSTAAYFNDLVEYPFLFRTVPSTEMYNYARIALAKKFGWRRFALIYDRDDESLALTSSLLRKGLIKNNFEVLSSTGISIRDGNYVQILERFKAFKTGMYGKKYVWIFSGNIRKRLMQEDHRMSCDPKDVIVASHLAITIGQLNYVIGNAVTITGETQQDLYNRYQRTALALGRSHRSYSMYAFDALIAVGLVINDTFRDVNWTDYSYYNFTSAWIVKSSFRRVRFVGMTGLVHFNQYSERQVEIAIQQVKDGAEGLVATFDNSNRIINVPGKNFAWYDGKVPLDRERSIRKLNQLPKTLCISLATIAAVGILICVALLITMLKFNKKKTIMRTSPKFGMVLLVGCLLCYSTVFLVGFSSISVIPTSHHSVCKARSWLLSFGFSLAFGSMFAVLWRKYRIMTNKALRKKLKYIDDRHLYTMIAIFLSTDVVYLLCWEMLDPLEEKIILTKPMEIPEKDLKIEPYTIICDCNHFLWWVAGIFFYKGSLLMFGSFLAYETRNIYASVNESRSIAFQVYNVAIFSVLGAITAIVSNKYHLDFMYGIINGCILLCSTVMIIIRFLPKVVSLLKGKQDGIPLRNSGNYQETRL